MLYLDICSLVDFSSVQVLQIDPLEAEAISLLQ